LGAVIFAVGAILLMLVPARNMLGVGDGGSGAFYAVGGIVVLLGTIFLMRSGGYISVSLISLLTLMLVSAYHMFGSSDVIQYTENTFLITTYAIGFLILCYLLLVYDDAKFFYLAKLIKDERNFRKKKEYKKAMSYCDRALLIYPYFATAWNNKGNVYMNMGKKDDAKNCYNKALSINPNYEPAMMNLQAIKRY
jgi:tetratricopeptide (TPR) repeat protein